MKTSYDTASEIVVLIWLIAVIIFAITWAVQIIKSALLSMDIAWEAIEYDPGGWGAYTLYRSKWGQYRAGCRFFWTAWGARRHWRKVEKDYLHAYRDAAQGAHSFLVSTRNKRYLRAVRFLRAIDTQEHKAQ